MEKTLSEEQIETVKTAVSDVIGEKMGEALEPMVGKMVVENVKKILAAMKTQETVYGRDVSGLSETQKKDFVKVAQAAAKGLDIGAFGATKVGDKYIVKANEALIEEQDNRGGFLVSRDVADAILRIAASVGTILSQAQRWPMSSDELAIPNYTGSFLTGTYLNVDVAGTVTGITFGQALLIAKKWQLAFVVGNDLMADANVNLADWLLALAGESLANMVDQQGLTGTGAPFVGVMNESGTTSYVLASGKTRFSNDNTSTPDGFDVLVDSSAMIGSLEESILDGASFVCHRTVWAAWRVQKDSSGNFVLPFAGIPSIAGMSSALSNYPGGGPVKPAGEILGYPVYTNRWMPSLPANNAASASTAFAFFGNMKAIAYGDRGDMRVAQFESGAFGGKEIALADQKGIVYKQRHGIVVVLPAAFVIATTAAS